MIGVITSEKSGSFERIDMKLYIWMRPGLIRINAMNGPFNNATVKIIKSFLSFFRSVGFRRTFTVYNSIHRTVRYASSLACSCNYLRKIRKFREDGYEIVYLDETWVNQNHATDYMWLPVDGSDAPKILGFLMLA
jgi:hypothetical protein